MQLAVLHQPWLGPFVGADHHVLFPALADRLIADAALYRAKASGRNRVQRGRASVSAEQGLERSA